jgi:high-affinity nickel-transport protein
VNPVTNWVAALNLNNVGFVIVALFAGTWVVALGYWRIAKVEQRWSS